MFVALGLSAIFPVLHGLKLYGFRQMCQQMGLLWVILQGSLYIIGAGFYAVSEVGSQSFLKRGPLMNVESNT